MKGKYSRRMFPPMIALFLMLVTAGCGSMQKQGAPAVPGRALWEGTWKSLVSGSVSGNVSAELPDPLPVHVEFGVEATISYAGVSYRVNKTVSTSMTGLFTEGRDGMTAPVLQFKGSILESGQTIKYTARPDSTGGEFSGEYTSGNPDDRGTFRLRKIKKLP